MRWENEDAEVLEEYGSTNAIKSWVKIELPDEDVDMQEEPEEKDTGMKMDR